MTFWLVGLAAVSALAAAVSLVLTYATMMVG